MSDSAPYTVTVRHQGCETCGSGKVWQVAEDRDGAVILVKTFRDEEKAGDLASWMNQAYERGFKAAKLEDSK